MTLRRSPLVLAGGGLLTALVVVAVLAPLIAPFDPEALAGDSLEQPSAQHLLGTNAIGQDIFSQIVWGARFSLSVAVGAASLAVVAGVVVGVGAALVGGAVDTIAMRLVDAFLALPAIPLAVLLAALVGFNRVVLILVIGLIRWPDIARLVRSQALSLRRRGFVEASQGFGGGLGYVMRRHLVPALGPVIVGGGGGGRRRADGDRPGLPRPG